MLRAQIGAPTVKEGLPSIAPNLAVEDLVESRLRGRARTRGSARRDHFSRKVADLSTLPPVIRSYESILRFD